MKMFASFRVEIFLSVFILKYATGDFFCSEQFCESYRQRQGCPLLSIGCQIQNETHNGEVFPSAEPCNCCDVCLENISEGGYCTVGSVDTAPPLYACGPGLKCSKDNESDDYVCKKMTDTDCFKEQIEFDKLQAAENTGSYMKRPKCNGDGKYGPIKCNPGQTCFCINEDGDRIFGEAPHSLYTELTMKCECSLLNDKLSHLLNSRFPVISARCLEDGSYDPLQCMGEICLCVDRNTGFSQTDTYNVTEVGFINLPCYNKTIHRRWVYLHNCEQLQHENIEEIQKSEADGFTIINFKGQECQPDGWFLPIQKNATHSYCADKYGRKLGEYAVGNKQSKRMNCLCAKTEHILIRAKVADLPACCPNGNFKEVQCRSDKCYCVDINGLQITKEVESAEVASLSCYGKGNFC